MGAYYSWMSEHAARYDELASELNKEDISVTAGDHRGHGELEER